MLPQLTEKENTWQFLKASNKPIVMYGMGDGAQKIMDVFEAYGIKFSDIFASDEFVRGHSFMGRKVLKYSEICSKYDDFIIVLAFAAFKDDLLNKIYAMAEEHTVLAPDVPVVGGGLFDSDYLHEHFEEISKVYDLLADELSRTTYMDILNYKISGKIKYLKNCAREREVVYPQIIRPQDNEIFVDLGAYNGDTIEEFCSNVSSYEGILAFEPDTKNFEKLIKKAEVLGVSTEKLFNIGVYNKLSTQLFASKGGRHSALSQSKAKEITVNSVDNILNGSKATIIKMDVEGAESFAIEGATSTILKYRPKLMISAYHKNEDIFALPLQIYNIRKDYKIYLRHHPYIPGWETNYYII